MKVIEEIRSTLLESLNTSELYERKGGFNLNNSLLVFQVKLAMPKLDDTTSKVANTEESLNSIGNMSVVVNSTYGEENLNLGQQLPDQIAFFKKQTSSDQDVEQVPLDETMDVYLAHIALTPCEYVRFAQNAVNEEHES